MNTPTPAARAALAAGKPVYTVSYPTSHLGMPCHAERGPYTLQGAIAVAKAAVRRRPGRPAEIYQEARATSRRGQFVSGHTVAKVSMDALGRLWVDAYVYGEALI